MPPTTKIKKFLKMRKDKASDLTLALDWLFKNPKDRIGNTVYQALDQPGSLNHPMDPTVWAAIDHALDEIANKVPDEDTNKPKVKEHVENWRDQDGKEALRQELVTILDEILNDNKRHKVEFNWDLFEQAGDDKIAMRDIGSSSARKLHVTFENSWEKVKGEMEIQVGPDDSQISQQKS